MVETENYLHRVEIEPQEFQRFMPTYLDSPELGGKWEYKEWNIQEQWEQIQQRNKS